MTGFSAIPLAEDGGDRDDSAHFAGVSKILGPRWAQLPAITVGLLGVQVLWSVEMSYGTPYLISLGLSKSAVAMVFLAGPVSGLVVQPLVGVLSDNSKSRLGRRRPYMLLGTIICTSAMLLLGFTRPFATLFTPLGSIANHILTIWLAILALFTIDFSINAVQAVDRALIVDTLPSREQADGNAWAARMLGIGSVAGYFVGNVDMTAVFPFFGNTELEVLSIVGSFLLIIMHAITAFCTKEKVIVAEKHSEKKSFAAELKELWINALTLPPVIRQICVIQFFSWVGWFPVLFYTTAFIGDLHKRAFPDIPAEDPALDAEATRLGSRALFYSSLLNLGATIVLPFFVPEAASSRRLLERGLGQARNRWAVWYDRIKVHLVTLWAVSHLLFAVCMLATFFYSSVWGATLFTTLTGFSWSITQWAPFSLLAEAILTEDQPANEDAGSIVLHDTRTRRRSSDIGLAVDEQERQFLVGEDDDAEDEHDMLTAEVRSFTSSASMDSQDEEPRERSEVVMGNLSAHMSHLDVHSGVLSDDETLREEGAVGSGLAAKAGIILGIHNVFIVMPQFFMTGIASIIFALLEPRKVSAITDPQHDGYPGAGNDTSSQTNATSTGTLGLLAREAVFTRGGGPNSYAVIFRLGGIAAAVAFVLTIRLARELRHQ
ncbi:General alpha-glucoside permease [Grifola frondosa]|uniref:General alpha-glucoside permease n=1 Tax=Grifola frondosa TaxID=5627 RepID=A0A1C7LNU0_GRIFR|nr:General alpha-glucoside permease [Grifola frondosa]